MSDNHKSFLQSKISWFFLLLIVGGVLTYYLVSQKSDAFVFKVKSDSIRDSITGSVRVLAGQSFDLRSDAQAQAVYSIMLPLGKSVEVEADQILFRLNEEDLNRSLQRTVLSAASHEKRLQLGSLIALQLEIEKKELEAHRQMHTIDGLPALELEKRENQVARLQKNLELEEISNQEISSSQKIEFKRLEAELAKRTVRSPVSGTLVSSSVKPGDMVFHSQVLGHLISKDRIVQVSLNEEDCADLKIGQKSGVTLFAFGNRLFEGELDRLEETIDANTGRRYAYVRLDGNHSLPVGASGRAEIVKNEIPQTLVIPRKALLGDSVLLVENQKVKIRKVQVGARNLEFVEVIGGLKMGDLVISQTPHLFYEDQRVNPILTSSSN